MTEVTSNLYLQLGIAGATLLILLVFVTMLFKLFKQINNNENSSQNGRIDKLCDKIDGLITSYAENTQKLNAVLLNSDKDQKNVNSTLDKILGVAIENQRRIARIDDRTYQCLGNPRKEVIVDGIYTEPYSKKHG